MALTLPPSDVTEAAKFRDARLRHRYLACRSFVRAVLGEITNEAPARLTFRYGEWGKPRLAHDSGIEFNYSHSEDAVLLAVTCGVPVGVDVERVREQVDTESVVTHFFSPAERREFAGVSPSLREQAFFCGWTRKEAFIKAVGMGLSYALDDFDVTLDPHRPARLLRAAGHDAEKWTLESVDFGQGYAAAVAVAAPNVEIHRCRFRDWQ